MSNRNSITLYREYYQDNNNENLHQFIILAEKFSVKRALYPGSFVHITPSLVFTAVTYVDNDKRAKYFFGDPEVRDFVEKHKLYRGESSINFLAEDYQKASIDSEEGFDLLISQYAGFVSKYCTKYLTLDGLLLVTRISHIKLG